METVYCVFNKSNETFLGLHVSVAATSLARLRGLLGKLCLRAGEGLWLIPSCGVHTIGVLFPIDVIYLNKQNRVVYLREHLTPFGIGRLRFDSSSVLELPPHTIYATGTRVGDDLLICPAEELPAHFPGSKNPVDAGIGPLWSNLCR